MKHVNVKSKYLLLTAVILGLVSVPSLSAEKKSWQDETVLVGKQGDQTVVRKMKGDKVLFQHKDAQLAIEWALGNARTTVVQAGKYTINDTIDVPRPNLTLVVAEGAVIMLAADSKLAAKIGSDAEDAKIVPLIYSKGLASFRCVLLGDLLFPKTAKKALPSQAYTLAFDGRGAGRSGFTLVATGTLSHGFLLLGTRPIQIPLLCPLLTEEDSTLLRMEDAGGSLGLIAGLAVDKNGKTGEVLNASSCSGIKINTIIGQRSKRMLVYGHTPSQVLNIVSIGDPEQLVYFGRASKSLWTQGGRLDRIDIWNSTLVGDDQLADFTRTIKASKLPQGLPTISVSATIEITLKNGIKKKFAKSFKLTL
jgi:hypothetical protein